MMPGGPHVVVWRGMLVARGETRGEARALALNVLRHVRAWRQGPEARALRETARELGRAHAMQAERMLFDLLKPGEE